MSGELPVVLVGGKSLRFGSDKLRAGVDGGWLVDRPIAALRAVYGPRVVLVGACDAAVAGRADGVVADAFPGAGPMGGIVSALRASGGAGIFVLAGDMPGVTAEDVRAVLAGAVAAPGAWAVLAEAGRLHPCFGVYRAGALATLEARLAAGERGLTGALPAERVARVAVAARAAANVNTPGELEGWAGAGGEAGGAVR